MEPLRWTYKLKTDIGETQSNAEDRGFDTQLLEGSSRTYDEPYPLNQLKISGRDLSPHIRIHVSPSSTQMYYYVEDFPGIEEVENILDAKEEAERILNCVVAFAPNEAGRFGQGTAKPVMSNSMIRLQVKLLEILRDSLDKIQSITTNEICHTVVGLAQGKAFSASERLGLLLRELESIEHHLMEMKREQNSTEADKSK